MRKELGTHLGTVKRKGKDVLEDIKDEVVYIPFLQNLEMLLQNDALRAQVYHNEFCFKGLHVWLTGI